MMWKDKLQQQIEKINVALDAYLPEEQGYPREIFESMRYSLFAGGKRLRPVLLLAACEALGGEEAKAMPFACAIEMIHTYSLIHDDLPAMDDDDYRRGKLTNHKMYGEDMAILAGDGLLHYAMEIMTNACCETVSPNALGAMQAIAHGSGIYGMLAGQVADVISGGKLDQATLEFIHKNKTAAMIQGALKAGASIAGADEATVKQFDMAGEAIGIAFQIQDDILDVVSTQNELGKPVHSDEKNKKTTFVTMFGIEKSEEQAKQRLELALEIWDTLGDNGQFLKDITQYIMTRKN